MAKVCASTMGGGTAASSQPGDISGRRMKNRKNPRTAETIPPCTAPKLYAPHGRFNHAITKWPHLLCDPPLLPDLQTRPGGGVSSPEMTMPPDNPVTDAERFALLIGTVADYAIYTLDQHGRIASWNTGAERLFGWSAAEMTGQFFGLLFTEQDRAAGFPEEMLDHGRRLGRYDVPVWRRRKDGRPIRCHTVLQGTRTATGETAGFAVITREFRESSEPGAQILRTLIEGVVDYALYLLDPGGIVSSWNPGAERLKGYKETEILGRHFERFYTEADRDAGVPARTLEVAATEGRFEAEGWRVRKDGSLFWANAVIDAIRDEGGTLIGFAKITRDITERREAQIALQEAQAQRAHAQKMEALGQLTGGVAHDFNNLLMVVTGHIYSLRNRMGDDPKVLRAITAIEAAAERGGALTRQLLSFSRRQTYTPTVIDLAELIETVGAMLESAVDALVEIEVTIDPGTWPIKVDSGELELALVNIVLNARDAMPQGGKILVEADNVYLGSRDTVSGIEGEFVALRLTDSGVGIAPDMLDKVFDPFFTTKAVGKGTGLGLSQVYGFVHQSGGTVTVDSLLGKGTTVTLYLPRAAKEADIPAVGEEASSQGGGIVLLVEDNPEVAEVSASMLQQAGYATRRVADAETALVLLESGEFDLVVSDIVMPGRYDGLELARLLRERKPGLPVLLVSGYTGEESEASQEFTVLRKPFRFAQLSQTVARVMAGR